MNTPHEHNNHELQQKLRSLSWLLVRREKMRGRRNPAGDPSRGQGRILAMLKIQDGIATRELAYLLGIRPSSLNESLGKLERTGLITRQPSAEDGRVMTIHLTEEGAATEQIVEEKPSLFAGFSADEQQQLGEYFDRLIAALEDEEGVSGPDKDRDGRRMREHFSQGRGGYGKRRRHGHGSLWGSRGWSSDFRHKKNSRRKRYRNNPRTLEFRVITAY